MHLTDEQRKTGAANFNTAAGVARRDFLRAAIGAGLSLAGGMGPLAFGYGGPDDMPQPVRVGVIGTGGQGNVLIGAMPPEYLQVTAICDIRPSAIHQAIHGDWSSTNALRVRPGLLATGGWPTEAEARRHLGVFDDYRELLKSPDVEAVVIALPLHLHHPVAMEAMAHGKHVYIETLMARTVGQCKQMARRARDKRLVCAVGHQRRYSVQYQSAAELLRRGLLGQICSVHAQWHRGNAPGIDSWQPPLPGGELGTDGRRHDTIQRQIASLQASLTRLQRANPPDAERIKRTKNQLKRWTIWDQDKNVIAKRHGYQDQRIGDRTRTALEELCRWRLWDRTCGGMFNELGHHQLDAIQLLLGALQGSPPRPLTVFATGDRSLFPETREVEDHATCVIEFAGPAYEGASDRSAYGFFDSVTGYPANGIPGHDQDPHKKITAIVTLTNGNGFAGYGERVLGTKGTVQMDRETEGLLFGRSSTSPVKVEEAGDQLRLDYAQKGKQPPEAGLAEAVSADQPSRGYREALEHWAWCIRHSDPKNQPRSGPQSALGTAALALTCSRAVQRSRQGAAASVKFNPDWLDIDSDAAPETELKLG